MHRLPSTRPAACPVSRSRRLAARLSTTCAFGVLMVLWLIAAGTTGLASAQEATEQRLKAAFLFQFGRFVEWPSGSFASPQSPLVLCVIGSDAFGETLDETVRGKVANGRGIEVRRTRIEAVGECHIAFVTASEKNAVSRIVAAARGRPVLLVGELPGFAAQGGVVNFIVENNRVHFEVNPAAAERSRLRISSKVLSLGRVVTEAGGDR